jgi:hypothetical protein
MDGPRDGHNATGRDDARRFIGVVERPGIYARERSEDR